jgi:molecular chaperone Hsp33
MTDDGSFRVIAVETTQTVRGAAVAQGATGDLARIFAELITGAVLVREAMAPDLRVQVILQGDDGRSRLVADAHPDGTTRGLVQLAKGATSISIQDRGLLQVARTMHNGAIHQGVVQVPSNGSLTEAFMEYMQSSEQVVTFIAVGSVMGDDGPAQAGGYLVQLLPELEEGQLMVMTERLKDFESMDALLASGKGAADLLLAETLYAMPHTLVGERELGFACNCSTARLAASLATLPREDIEHLVSDGKMLDIECDFCKTKYEFSPEQLRGLLTPN